MGRFNKGLLLGGLLGAGLVWLQTTVQGKEIRKKIMDASNEVYEQALSAVLKSKEWKNITKSDFVKTVRETVARFPLTARMKEMVVSLVSRQWPRVKEEIQRRIKTL